MYWRSGLQGVLQGDILTPLVFVLCVPGALLQSTPSNPVVLAPFSALEGSSVNLTCISTGGNPLPTVTWYRGNQIVDQSYRTNSFGSTTQTINDYVFNVYRNDSSVTYRCDVDNANLGSPLKKTAILTVYVQPGPPVITGSSVLTAGSTYTHKCRTSAGGNPIPTLNWMLGNQSISDLAISQDVISLNDNTYIVEKNITWVPVASDNGKNLSCALSHNETLGSTTRLMDSFIITVQVLPNITTSITSYSRTVGDSVTLACSVVAASPSVTSVYWTKLSNSVTTNVTIDGSKFQGSTTSVPSLTINTLQTTDAGVYTCNAVNAAGTGSGLGILLSITGSLPSVSIPFNTYTVNVGNSLTMVCNVASTLTVTSVRWERNTGTGFSQVVTGSAGGNRFGGATISSPSLVLNSAQISDQGSYKCLATNSAGTGESSITSLSVQGNVPTVQTSQTSYTVNQGNTVTLVCSVSSSTSTPLTRVQWQRITGSTTTNVDTTQTSKYSGSTTTTPSLTILNVQSSDAGSYRCTATNSVGTGQGLTISLNVNVPPTINLGQSSYTVNHGSSITLVCSISSNSAILSVTWQQITSSGTTVTVPVSNTNKYSGGTTSSPNLIIFNADQTDAGSYRCLATSSAGTGQSNFASLTVVGNVPSVSITSGSSLSVAIGNTITIACIVSANPSATSITWQRTSNGVTTTLSISGNSRYSGGSVSSPSLTISNVQLSDEGNYQCRASNSAGTGSSGITFLDVTGNIPSVVTGSGTSVTIGNQVIISCSITGSPAYTSVTWTREVNGVTTTLNIAANSRYSGGTVGNPSITITNVQQSDEGNYRCSASNTVGTGQSSTTAFLDVQGGTPNVVIGSGSSPTVGTTATISCSVSGTPSATSVSWERTVGGVTTTLNLGNTAKYSGGTTGNPSLTIFNVQNSDSGNYVCKASNSLGTSSSGVAVLNVVGNTPTVQVGSSTYTVNAGNTAQLVCTITSQNPSATSVTWQKLVNGVRTTFAITGRYSGGTVSNPTLSISNVQTSDAGTYYCFATNSVGQGSPAQTVLAVQSAPSVSIPSSSYPVNYNANTTLICSVTATPSATGINWYKVVNGVDTLLSISGNSRLSGGTTSQPSLTVTFAVFNDEGSYKCEASNLVGATRSVATFLDVIGSSPNVTIPISSYSAVYGNSVTINCTVSASPAATLVSWQQIVNSQSTTINPTANPTKYSGSTTSTPSLTINNLVTADSGYYVCSATNPAGTTVSGQTLLTVTGTTPTVSANPTSYSENYGTNVTLQCSVSGNPAVTAVYWSKTTNGVTTNITTNTAQSSSKYSGVTVSNPSLQITSLTLSDSGSYVCFGINSVGSSQTSSVTLNVIGDLPSVTIGQSSYSVTYGNSVTLNCSYTSTPSATGVSWQRTANSVSTVLSTTGSSKYSGGTLAVPSLTVFSATDTDEGFYTCSVTNAIGTASSSSAFLDVITTIPSVSIPSNSYSVNYGNSITIPCTISSNPFQSSVYWQRTTNGVTTTLSVSGRYSGATVNSPALIISGAVTTDSGSYVCFATNSAGTGSSNAAVLTVVGNAPTVNIPNTQYTVTHGNSVSIPCFVSGSPSVTSISWVRISGGTTTTINIAGSSGKYSGGSTSSPSLTITNTNNNDEGTYRCSATNAVGTSQDSTFLDVQGNTPSVTISQSTYTINYGSSVTLACSVSGSPSATSVQWYKVTNSGSVSINVGGSSRYSGSSTSNPSLTIVNTVLSDEGSYQCTATNSVGTGSSSTTYLDIVATSPTVSIPSSSYSVIYGSTITIPCSVSANPSATSISWYKDSSSTPLVITGRYSGATTSNPSLTISSAQLSEEGNYRCSATNAVGTGNSITTYLDVIGSVPSVTIGSAVAVIIGNNATIQCSFTANPNATSVSWQRTSGGQTSTVTIGGRFSGGSTSDPSLKITNAQSSDEGSYRCFVTNNVGQGQSGLVFLDVQGNIPTVTLGNNTYSVITGQSVTIDCTVSATPTQTLVYWQVSDFPGQTATNVTIDGQKYSGGTIVTPSLTITDANATLDEGYYRCFSVNAAGQGQSIQAFLDVTGNVPTVTIPSNSYSATYGNSITIPCSIASNPSASSMRWEKTANSNTDILTTTNSTKYSGGTLSDPPLTISNLNFDDQATYRCVASNQVGDGFSIATFLTVQGSNPSVSIPQSQYQVTLGNSLTIPCSISSSLTVTGVTWQILNGQGTSTINIAASGGKYSGGSVSIPSLTINNVGNSDEGSYRCLATNSAGSGQSQLTFVDVVGSAPSVTIPQNIYQATIGSTVTLTCSTSGSPAVTSITWQRVKSEGVATLNVAVTTKYGGATIDSPSLIIYNVSTNDEAQYRCLATNSAGTGQSQLTFLDVTGNAPTVSVPQNFYSALIGTNAQMPCSISANPATTSVYWLFNPTGSGNNVQISQTGGRYTVSSIANNPTLSITNVTFSDTGTYTCTAVNAVGTGTDGTDFNVTGSSPSVSIAQPSYSVLTGNTITIPCTITASPSISNRYWIFDPSGSGNNEQITTTSGRYTLGANTNSPSLTISNAVAGDAGTYMCFATNLVGTTSDSATLTITGDEPNITISVTSYSILLNGNVTLACQVETAQPSVNSVAWRFRSQGSSSTSEINIAGNPSKFSGGSLSTPSLTITQVENSDEGYYICTATNLVGTGNGTEIFLNVSGSGPTVSIPLSSYSVLQTQDVTLQCNVNNASPSVTSVTWYYSTTANNPNPSMVNITGISRYSGGTTTTPSLTITGAESGDTGYYRCSATNAVSTATSGYTSLAVTGATPSGTSIAGASSQDIDQTNTLSLTCSASGDPTPTITWSLNGQTLSSTNGVYTKVNVQRADDGVYTCTATNSLGSQTATVDVNVRFAPVASSSQQTINAATGSTQTLTCSVEANPTASYQWTRNNVVVGSSNTYTKTFGTGDFGDYICTATNTLGTATVTFTVSQSSASVGASTASGGLTTGEIAAIVLAVLLILLLIIVICICCCTHGVCGAICGKKKDAKGRVEPVKEKEVYKESIRHIEIPRFEEKPKVSPLPPIATDMSRYEKERDREGRQESFRSYPYGIYKRREHSAVSRRDVDVNVKRENDYDIVRYETVPPAGTYYGDTIISVHDDVRASPRPHRLPALTTYTYEEAERRRKHRRKKKKHRRRHDDEEVIVEKVRTASPVRVIEEVAPVRVIEEPAETVIVERVRTASPVRYVEEPAQDVIIESVRRSPSTRRKRSDEEEMIVRTSSRSPSRRRRHEERYVTTERVVNGDVYRDGGDLRAINGEVYRDSGEYSLSRHGSGRFTRESRSSRRKEYAGSDDVEVEEGSAYYVERR